MKLYLLYLALALTCVMATALPQSEQSSDEEFHSAQEDIFESAEDGSFHSAEQGDEELFHSAEGQPEGKFNQTVTARGKTLLPALIAMRSKTTASPPTTN